MTYNLWTACDRDENAMWGGKRTNRVGSSEIVGNQVFFLYYLWWPSLASLASSEIMSTIAFILYINKDNPLLRKQTNHDIASSLRLYKL